MKEEYISEESIKILVNNFYDKVRKNKEIGPIFENKIGKLDEKWQSHLSHMYDFWSSMMLLSGRYKRSPLEKHRNLPFFDQDKFDIWLELFAKTAHEVYVKEIASQFIEKSQNIARSLKYALYYKL